MPLLTKLHNTDREWNGDVGEEILDATTGMRVKQAFFEEKAQKIQWPPGKRLYKFNDYPSLAAGPEPWRTVSPWWSPYEEYEHDGGWEARARMAQHLHISVREWGRMTSVVKEGWNSLSYLLVITFKQPTWTFWGTFAGLDRGAGGYTAMKNHENLPRNVPADFKPELKGKSKGLVGAGGASQFYIPGLRVMHIATWATTSLLNQ